MRSDFLTTDCQMVLYDWLNKRIGVEWSPSLRCLGRVVDNEIVGVVGYNSHTDTSCQMHWAGAHKHWLTRTYLKSAFDIAFRQYDYDMVFASIPSGYTDSLKLVPRLGFRELIRLDGAHSDGAIHLFQMKREECPWFGGKHHGKERAESA